MNSKKISFWATARRNMRRSPFQTFAAVLIMWLTFLVISFLVVVMLGSKTILNYFETRPEISVYLKDQAGGQIVQQFKEKISQMDGVKEVKFTSKEDALAIYKKLYADNPLMLEMVSASILPASLEISADSPESLTAVAEALDQETNLVEEVSFRKDVVENISFWTKVIKTSGLIYIGIMTFVSIVVIMVIISLKVSNYRQEIKVLRSLGATPFYIKAPFLLEGLFYGFWGSVLGVAIVSGVVYYFQKDLASFFAPILIFPNDISFLAQLAGGEILAGCFVGFTAAFFAVNRFIKKRT